MGYALYFFRRIFLMPRHIESEPFLKQPVSIIICAKNEAVNLQTTLPKILSQVYTDDTGKQLYEVIVVDDGSDDDTQHVLNGLQQSHKHLRVLTQAGGSKGKKNALKLGVAAAGNDWLLLTDADCCPVSDNWVGLMVEPLSKGKELVAGYSGYYATKGWLNAFIRWETLHTFIQYSSYALTGMPYMAVGRNLACTKHVLMGAMKQPLWEVLPSGDDDLLVRIAGTADNTTVVSQRDAFTYSAAKTSWREWAHQKQRHLSTGKYYKRNIKWLLGVYGISHAAMWIAFFILLCTGYYIPAFLIIGKRCFAYWGIWFKAAHKLDEKKLVYFFPFFDFGWMIYNFAFLPYITLKNKKNWK